MTSSFIATTIDRSMSEVYACASNPANLPAWAAGVAGTVARVNGEWIGESPMGRITIAFVLRRQPHQNDAAFAADHAAIATDLATLKSILET